MQCFYFVDPTMDKPCINDKGKVIRYVDVYSNAVSEDAARLISGIDDNYILHRVYELSEYWQ